MAIDGTTTFGRRFGMNAAPQNQTTAKEDLPKAEFWLNIGYYVEVPDTRSEEENATKQVFISLPQGIALDTMKHIELKGSQDYVNQAQARNDLLDQIVARCRLMEPGEEVILMLNDQVGLAAQLRRVKEAVTPVKSSENQFSRKLALVPKAA